MTLKEAERRKESKYIFIVFIILTLFITHGSLHLSHTLVLWGPCGVISLLQYNFVPTNLLFAVISKYITFLYVINLTIHLYVCSFM